MIAHSVYTVTPFCEDTCKQLIVLTHQAIRNRGLLKQTFLHFGHRERYKAALQRRDFLYTTHNRI